VLHKTLVLFDGKHDNHPAACFSIVTGSARAVSRSKPKAFFAFLADIDFIADTE
jgi:hypothetical protein